MNALDAGNSVVTDIAGDYEIAIWEFKETLGYTAGHDADRVADARFDLRATTDATISVSPSMDLPIEVTSGDNVTLRVLTNGNVVSLASLVTPATEKARIAASQTAVTAALAALVGATTATIGTDLQDGTADLRAVYEAHLQQTAGPRAHLVADTANVTLINGGKSLEGSISLLNEL